MLYFKWIVLIVLFFMGCAATNQDTSILLADNPIVRVLIVNSYPEVEMISQAPWQVTDLDGTKIMTLSENLRSA